jgi:hypothetical protein
MAFQTDVAELTEIRARQRTFEGAYVRSALANLGYSLAILRLFDRRFFRSILIFFYCDMVLTSCLVGILYAIMAMLLLLCAYLRAHFADHRHRTPEPELAGGRAQPVSCSRAIRTQGHQNKLPIGPPFVSAGRVVVLVAFIVVATEIALVVLVLEL